MQPTSVASQAVSNGQTATNSITAGLRDFFKNVAGTPSSSQAESDISSFGKMTPATADILRSFDTQYGVDDASKRVAELRKSVVNAEDLVNNVSDNVFARTSGALVSDAQRARLTAAEKDPLLKQLGTLNSTYGLAQEDLSSAQGQSSRFSGAELGDIETMRGSLKDRYGTAKDREAEAARIKAEEEENRRWWANFNEQKRQFEAQIAASNRAIEASKNRLASFQMPTSQPASQAAAANKVTQTYKNAAGQVIGYETPTRSQLTDVGMKEQEALWRKESRNGLQKVLGGVGDWTGWF